MRLEYSEENLIKSTGSLISLLKDRVNIDVSGFYIFGFGLRCFNIKWNSLVKDLQLMDGSINI